MTLRKPFDLRVARTRTWEQADAVMARFAPFALLALPFAWVTLVILGFAPVFWALGAEPRDALVVSGSSLLTLGFAVDLHGDAVAVTFVEATLGLGLVALLISFLPSIYQQFSHREVLVSQLETRAGSPPAPIKLFRRAHRIHWDMEELWTDWELWFAEVQESHTSYLALPYFRSPRHNLSWITSAGAVLDAAALRASTLEKPRSWQAELCIRAGYLALRRISDTFGIPYDDDPSPGDPISIERSEYDELVDEMVEAGVPVKADRDQAWRDFAGWRVNYDAPLIALCGLLMAPYAPWSSDRGINYRVRVVGSLAQSRRVNRRGDP